MKTNKVAILTVASLATLTLANNVKADSQDSPVSSQEAPSALVTNSEGNNTTGTKQPTEVTKEGTEITVKNPDVNITYPEGHGIYAKMQVNYHVDFPDELIIKENDTVEMKLPEVMEFPTSYSFNVTNPEGKVVGNAVADSSLGKVTTTFNNYFESHPLKKQMNLELTTRWTDAVKPDTKFEISLDGTVIPITVDKEVAEQDGERVLSKWGNQSMQDPTVIDWTIQLNYGNLWSNQVLTDFQLLDKLGDNQVLIEDSISAEYVTSVTPWVSAGDAMNQLKDLKTNPYGFEFKIANLNKLIYIHYKSKLLKAESESFNPTNHVEAKWTKGTSNNQGFDAKVKLINGKGDASGENKPVWKIPNDAPKYEKPEININDIPLMPPAPILDKPEYPIPAEPEKPNTPPSVPGISVTPKEEPKVPSESPKVEPKKEEVKVENKSEVSHETPVETYRAPMLPQTGSEAGVALSVLGLTVLSLTVVLKKK
jgi:LPXTG-motif cell wall-anchored protein